MTRPPDAWSVPLALRMALRQGGFSLDVAWEGRCRLLGLFGPRTMSPERRDRIAADVLAVAAEPAIAERMAAIGQIARGRASIDFAAATAS